MEFSKMPLDQLPLTMVYIPMQRYSKTYDKEEALSKGTLFPELDKPFTGKRNILK